MTRTHAIKRLLEHGPLQIEALLHIMGGDREDTRASVGVLMLTHEIYCSRGWYQLNRPRDKKPHEVKPKAQNDFALQAVW